MSEYDIIYKKKLRISAAAHFALLALFLCVNFIQGCITNRRPKVSEELIEFTVAIPPDADDAAASETEAVGAETPTPDEPDPDVLKTQEPPPDSPKPEKRKIEISNEVVSVKPKPAPTTTVPSVKFPDGPRAPSKLTEAEIAELLRMGAKPGAETLVPSEAQRNLLIIKNTCYSAWRQPASEYDTGRGAVVSIKIGTSGVVLDKKLTQSSGNKTFDQSALDAVAAVPRFNGLSKNFLAAYEDGVSVEFKLK